MKKVGIVVLLLTTVVLTVPGQRKVEALKEKRVSIQVSRKPLFDVFMRLIYDYDVTIGLEESVLDREHNDYHFETNIPYAETPKSRNGGKTNVTFGGRPKIVNHLISLDHEDARLDDVLDDIVRQMHYYDWEVNDEVINIFPTRERNPIFKRLLELRINEFVVWKGADVGMIQPLIILQLPEVRKFLDDNHLLAESDRVAPWYIDRPLPREMKFTDLTFKELLNAITRSKRGGWIMRHKKAKDGSEKKSLELLI